MDADNTFTNTEKLQAMVFAIEHGLANVKADKQPAITLLIDFKGFGRRHLNPKLGAMGVLTFSAAAVARRSP